MDRQININGTATDIIDVNVDGTNVDYLNLDGTVLWQKNPTTAEISTALSNATAINYTSRTTAVSSTYINSPRMTEDGSGGSTTKTHTLSLGSEDDWMKNSDSLTLVGIGSCSDIHGGNINSMSYVSGGTTYTPTMDTQLEYEQDYASLRVRTAAVSGKNLSDITSWTMVHSREGNNDLVKAHQIILPNRWEASLVSASSSGSHSLGAGEIIIISASSAVDGYVSSSDVANSVTAGSNTRLVRTGDWWYKFISVGIYVNNTSSSQTISWSGSTYSKAIKLTQTGY